MIDVTLMLGARPSETTSQGTETSAQRLERKLLEFGSPSGFNPLIDTPENLPELLDTAECLRGLRKPVEGVNRKARRELARALKRDHDRKTRGLLGIR